MKKQFKRGLSAILSLLMVISLLPAQFALATDDPNNREMNPIPVTYGTADDLPTSGFKGHVVQLKKVTDNANYDYEMIVSAYNMDATWCYELCMDYDNSVVDWVRRNGKSHSDTSVSTSMLTAGKVTADMLSSTAAGYTEEDDGVVYKDRTLNTALFKTLWSAKVASTVDNINKITVQAVLDLDLVLSDWTNAASGASAIEKDGSKIYKFPENKLNTLYSMYFKLKDSSKDINENTFKMAYENVSEYFNGSCGVRTDASDAGVYTDEQTYLIGFPEKQAAKQTATFTVQNSTGGPVPDAIVTVYEEDAARARTQVDSGTTNSDGHYTTQAVLSVGKTYSYTISKTGMETANGTFTVDAEAAVTVPTVTMTKTTDKTWTVEVTVTNADTKETVPDVNVSIDGVSLGTTNGFGVATGKVKSGKSVPLELSKSGYETKIQNVEIQANDTNTISISMEPQRAEVTVPTISADGADDVTVEVTQTEGSETAWGKVGTTKTYNQSDIVGGKIKLPKGNTYTMTIGATGFVPQTITVEIDSSGTVTYKNDKNEPINPSESLPLEKMDDPFYNVKIVKSETNARQYIATVTLRNINAEMGTFGIKYDKDVFDYKDYTLSDDVQLFDISTGNAAEDVAAENPDEGYHVFSWAAKGYDTDFTTLDTRSEAKTIATYTFELKGDKNASDITSDAFTVMPFDKTKEGRDYINDYPENLEVGRQFTNQLWRYTDDTYNDETNPAPRRLAKSKATLNGFYQVQEKIDGETAVTPDDDTNNPLWSDVRTYFDFEFEKSALTFVVTDEDNLPLNNADIKLYDTEGNVVDTITTNASGMVTYPVDGAATFDYIASCPGYWDVPETDKRRVEVKDKETTTEYVVMEKKIYHTPVLEFADDSTPNKEQVELTGNKFAYNGRDFFFNIEAKTGYKITDVDFVVIVTDDDDVEHSYPKATQEGMYFLDKANIIGTPAEGTVPDVNGFKAKDIKIKITSVTVEEDDTRYTATASVGANGQVEYTAETNDYPLPAGQTSPTTGPGSIVISDINPADTTKTLGKFTFTAASGYKVEKVFVNGVQIHDYDDKDTFDYKFTDLSKDNDIAVTFYNGTPSGESVVTLVVGPNGTVDVSKPLPAETGIADTVKTYVYTANDITASNNTLEFTATANGAGTTKVQIDDGTGKTDLNPTGSNYKVTVGNNETKTVYVTFDDNTIFVKAYVKSGEGTISPVGVLIKKKHDSITVTATAKSADPGIPGDKDWSAAAVDVNGTEKSNTGNVQPFVYTVDDIIEDTEIGAIFKEAAYVVTGLVDLSQNSNIAATQYVQTPATVTFVRKEDNTTITVETTKDRQNAAFSAELPKGTWTVTVKKKGYLDYIITDYEVGGEGNQKFGMPDGSTNESDIRKITPYIGNTNNTGMTVSLGDAAVIVNGLRPNANSVIVGRSDVDDNASVAYSDLVYVKFNYGRRLVKEPYSTFVGRTTSLPGTIPDSEVNH